MSSDRIGVVVPAFNAAPFVRQCLESALAQDCDDLRVYVVDDASTDQTRAIISEVAGRFPGRVVWTARSENRGEGFTRQQATEMALDDGCKYIVPLDADDLRKPGSIRHQVEALERAPNAGVCYGKMEVITSKGELHPNPGWERITSALKGLPQGEVWDRLIAFGKVGALDAAVFRAQVCRACRYDPTFRYLADVDYLAQAATQLRQSNFIAVNEVVKSYRFHANQSVNRIARAGFVRMIYDNMRTVALRVFWRLEQQGRAVTPRRRRRLWRILVCRTMLSAMRWGSPGELLCLTKDFVLPLRRLERDYKSLQSSEQLRSVLGVWADADG